MDINNLSSMYMDNIKNQNATGAKLNQSVNNADYANASDEELMNACKQFESYFLEMVFKEMQKTVDCLKEEETNPNGNLVDFFKDNAIQDLASSSTEVQGLGLAQTLFEQMKRNYNI